MNQLSLGFPPFFPLKLLSALGGGGHAAARGGTAKGGRSGGEMAPKPLYRLEVKWEEYASRNVPTHTGRLSSHPSKRVVDELEASGGGFQVVFLVQPGVRGIPVPLRRDLIAKKLAKQQEYLHAVDAPKQVLKLAVKRVTAAGFELVEVCRGTRGSLSIVVGYVHGW